MSTLVVGIGNTLRGDDGVGPFVIDLLREARGGCLELRTAFGVVPELAQELPGHDAVVFVDADLRAREVTLSPLATEERDRLHRFALARVVKIARALGFVGRAWICSVPVISMEPGEKLSREAVLAAGRAAAVLLDARWGAPPVES
ncbi:MAG TPA: hydrogenase maturation protease [Myxococcaceae bacterium]|nr:hydrogenase maturation protease [Myxococcaceae bacterium]